MNHLIISLHSIYLFSMKTCAQYCRKPHHDDIWDFSDNKGQISKELYGSRFEKTIYNAISILVVHIISVQDVFYLESWHHSRSSCEWVSLSVYEVRNVLVEREAFSDVLCLEVSDPPAMCPDISAVRDPPHPLSILLLRVIKLERLTANWTRAESMM